MPKLLISLSMSYERADAKAIVRNELSSVAEHIAKIFAHAPSVWDKKWKGDMRTFFPRIILAANNVKRQKTLKLADLEKILLDCFKEAAADTLKMWNSRTIVVTKSTKKERAILLASVNILLPELAKSTTSVAKLILANDVEKIYPIVDELYTATMRARAILMG